MKKECKNWAKSEPKDKIANLTVNFVKELQAIVQGHTASLAALTNLVTEEANKNVIQREEIGEYLTCIYARIKMLESKEAKANETLEKKNVRLFIEDEIRRGYLP